MSRKIKVIISVLVAVVMLTVGNAATVMANGEATPPPEAGAECFLARVAQILGITWEDMTNAFEQARQEIRDEHCIGPGEQAQQEVCEEYWIVPGEQVQQEIRNEYCIGFGEQLRQRIRNQHCIESGEQVQQRNTYRWRTRTGCGLK